MWKATALTTDDEHDHPRREAPAADAETSQRESDSPAAVAEGSAGQGVRWGVRIGAAATVSAMFLTLGLHGSNPAEGSAGASLEDVAASAATALAGTQLAEVTDAQMIDRVRRASAAARTARSQARAALTAQEEDPEPTIVGKRFTTVALNVRTRPNEDAKILVVLDRADKVTITDGKKAGWREVVYKGQTRWVKSAYLSKTKPKPRPKGPSSAPCSAYSGGSGMESGLTHNAIRVHRAVCAAFPSVTTYGGVRGGGGNHGSGRAVDIMVSGGTGDAIAAYVRAHAAQLGVTEVIWRQRIWTTQRASEGWRWMSDRGSATDNHYDHVHVTVG